MYELVVGNNENPESGKKTRLTNGDERPATVTADTGNPATEEVVADAEENPATEEVAADDKGKLAAEEVPADTEENSAAEEATADTEGKPAVTLQHTSAAFSVGSF